MSKVRFDRNLESARESEEPKKNNIFIRMDGMRWGMWVRAGIYVFLISPSE
uniref:Uncharacterized protein n=1 Tax=Marinobacter nauticus TaxID=2743 RepID=A0A455W769_MARNT|nr:hypothetical protein YBY_02430 [Marinobacter nauticus]